MTHVDGRDSRFLPCQDDRSNSMIWSWLSFNDGFHFPNGCSLRGSLRQSFSGQGAFADD